MNTEKSINVRTKIPNPGTAVWKKEILKAIASGKVKYTLPKKPPENPSAEYVFLMSVLSN